MKVEMAVSPGTDTELFKHLLQGWILAPSSSGTTLRTVTQRPLDLDLAVGGFISSQQTSRERVVPWCAADPQVIPVSSPLASLWGGCKMRKSNSFWAGLNHPGHLTYMLHISTNINAKKWGLRAVMTVRNVSCPKPSPKEFETLCFNESETSKLLTPVQLYSKLCIKRAIRALIKTNFIC